MEDTAQNKKSPWMWISVIIAVVVVLGLGYYFVMAKQSVNQGPANVTPETSTNSAVPATATKAPAAPSNNIYMMKTDAAKGTYLTDFAGMTLYTYEKDQSGVSNCKGDCTAVWLPYTSGATAQSQFPANITVIIRTDDRSKQFAWKGMPLYYFASDKSAGQITGDGVNGFHIIK